MSNRLEGRRKGWLERRQRVCEPLLGRGHVDVNGLSKHLGVNPATIQRDLEKLETEGAAPRVYGGADPGSACGGMEIGFSLRMNFHAGAKPRIVAWAAATSRSEQVILVADRSKFGTPTLISIILVADVDAIITDSEAPGGAAVLRALKTGLAAVAQPG